MDYAILSALREPRTWLAFALTLIISGAGGWLWARARAGVWNVPATLGAALALSIAFALTVPVTTFPMEGAGQRWSWFAAQFVDGQWWQQAAVEFGPSEFGRNGEQLANVVLFAPWALLMALGCRKPFAVALWGVGLSLLVESWQAVSGTRSATLADVLANVIGIVAVAIVVAVILRLRRSDTTLVPDDAHTDTRPSESVSPQ